MKKNAQDNEQARTSRVRHYNDEDAERERREHQARMRSGGSLHLRPGATASSIAPTSLQDSLRRNAHYISREN